MKDSKANIRAVYITDRKIKLDLPVKAHTRICISDTTLEWRSLFEIR